MKARCTFALVAPLRAHGWSLVRRKSGARPFEARASLAVAAVPALALLALIPMLESCGPGSRTLAANVAGGDPARGPDLIRYYGCGSCHEIPGVPGAGGMVGPPLHRIARRAYLAGVLPNTPDNMIAWIRDPHGVDEHTVMPNMGVTEPDARDIAAFLYTLR